jgi:UDP-N-acetylmuramoyl-tripeptide--D-alanyl-D-alanine ligase
MAAIAVPCRAILLATVRRYPRVLVLEYSASDNGDVGRLAALATPTVAIVTTVGPAHLDRFGTVERVAEEKAALVRHVPSTGLVILGQNNAYTAAMDRCTTARVVKVPGKGRALSEAIARVVGDFFGVPEAVVERAIRECGPVKGRLVVHELGAMTVIDDTFNANPLSMQLGLETMGEMAGGGQRKVAVLGDMAELGVEARRYHVEMGAFARARADLVIGVGEMARAYEPDHWFETSALCAASLPALLHEGDIVYLKGSHSVHMERVAATLVGAGA